MKIQGDLRTCPEGKDFLLFAGTPVVYHCHHFNLFLDQTITDALGHEESARIRFEAAREASHQLIGNVATALGAELPAEKLAAACELFRFMGHGTLSLLADASGGQADGEYLHYGFAWREKYGKMIKRNDAADAVASGFAAATLEVAFELPRESVNASETHCLAKRDNDCQFELTPFMQGDLRDFIDEKTYLGVFFETLESQNEETIAAIADGLRDFTAQVSGDERGLIQAFGVFVTMHLAGYYNRISYDTERLLAKKAPQSVGIFHELLRESGHVCVFNTIGGIMLSPEWEGMIGKPSGVIEETVTHATAIGRALGFGHWAIEELEPGRRLVLRTPNSYESSYYLSRHGKASKPNSYFLQGAALAIMVLAHKLDWKNNPKLDQKTYNNLFRGGLGWQVEETQSLSTGGRFSEFVVTKKE